MRFWTVKTEKEGQRERSVFQNPSEIYTPYSGDLCTQMGGRKIANEKYEFYDKAVRRKVFCIWRAPPVGSRGNERNNTSFNAAIRYPLTL